MLPWKNPPFIDSCWFSSFFPLPPLPPFFFYCSFSMHHPFSEFFSPFCNHFPSPLSALCLGLIVRRFQCSLFLGNLPNSEILPCILPGGSPPHFFPSPPLSLFSIVLIFGWFFIYLSGLAHAPVTLCFFFRHVSCFNNPVLDR